MFKKLFIAAVVLFVLVLALGGCSSQSKPAAHKSTRAVVLPEPPTQKATVHMSLAGNWTAEGSTPDGGMNATIDDTGIVVNWTGPNVEALYWKGTFPLSAGNEKVVSKGDVAEMEHSLMAESIHPNSKEFEIKDGKIHFTVSIQGVTKSVTLDKD